METAEGRAQKKPIVIEFIRTSLAISLAKDAGRNCRNGSAMLMRKAT